MIITSVQNQTIKSLVHLKTKKGRDEAGRFMVEGAHLIEEAWQAGLLEAVYALEGETCPCSLEPVYCSQNVLNKLSSQKSDARLIGICKKPEYTLKEPSKILLLEHIQDPGNAGTLIRSAYAFGAQAVLLSEDCADLYAPKTVQATQGALFHIPCIPVNLEKAVQKLKDRKIPVYAAALHQNAVSLHDLCITPVYAIMIGNEGQGLSQTLLDLCDTCVFIEMQSFESLNAAVAGSILLYQFQFPQANG